MALDPHEELRIRLVTIRSPDEGYRIGFLEVNKEVLRDLRCEEYTHVFSVNLILQDAMTEVYGNILRYSRLGYRLGVNSKEPRFRTPKNLYFFPENGSLTAQEVKENLIQVLWVGQEQRPDFTPNVLIHLHEPGFGLSRIRFNVV